MPNKLPVATMKTVLKKEMKAQQKSYSDLSKHLACSEVTAKRVLNQEELTLSRLSAIMNWLDLSFTDLEYLANKELESTEASFTEEHERFFVKNPEALIYLFYLYNKDQVGAKKIGKSAANTNKILSSLEKQQLIEWLPDNKVQLVHTQMPRFISAGIIQKKIYKAIVQETASFFIKSIERKIDNNLSKDKGGFSFTSVILHPETYAIQCEQLKKWQLDLERDSRRDEMVHPKEKLKEYAFVLGHEEMLEKDDSSMMFEKIFLPNLN